MTAFAGVRVLDCSGGRAGAMAAMHLGDLGARVVRVDATDDERGVTSLATSRGIATRRALCSTSMTPTGWPP